MQCVVAGAGRLTSERNRLQVYELVGSVVLERYRIEERITCGGTSVVYRGYDNRLRRDVCVKVFFARNLTDPSYETTYDHFVQEAFTLSQLRHPTTIQIFDFGYLEQPPHNPFHVSEFLEGGTLRDAIQVYGPLNEASALELMSPVADALSEAHARGIVHRDLKPTNILFADASGLRVVKLADFGIAKVTVEGEVPNQAPDTRVATGDRFPLCSIGWAAPEQMRGDGVGITADVFGFGLTMAFVLTGERVYSLNHVENLNQRFRGDEYVSERLAEMGIHEPMRAVLERACRTVPEERFPSIEDMQHALWAAVAGNEHEAAAEDADSFGGERVQTVPETRPPPQTRPTAIDPSSDAKSDAPASAQRSTPDKSRSGSPATPKKAKPGTATKRETAEQSAPPRKPQPTNKPEPASASPKSESKKSVSKPRPPAKPQATEAERVERETRERTVMELDGRRDSYRVGPRTVRLLGVNDAQDLAFGRKENPTKIRLTPFSGDQRVHLRGLNCFVQGFGKPPSTATTVAETSSLKLVSPDGQPMVRIDVVFPQRESHYCVYDLDDLRLRVPSSIAASSVLVAEAAGRELYIVYGSEE